MYYLKRLPYREPPAINPSAAQEGCCRRTHKTPKVNSQETNIRMYIDYVIEDNYHRIKDDISMTLQSQGIGVESGAEEVSTDTGQPQVHEDDDAQGSGPTDGIVEEAEPEAKVILPVDEETRD